MKLRILQNGAVVLSVNIDEHGGKLFEHACGCGAHIDFTDAFPFGGNLP